ncbi:MAG: FAD-binding protein [Bacteroidales bacterium]|nr:FAD-binding protein [Bacteroidales bacterium]
MKFDVVIIGGGAAGAAAGMLLQQAGKRCAIVAGGLSLNSAPLKEFRDAGGTLLSGDRAVGAELSDGRIKSIKTEKLGSTPLEAENFILASGRFFSRGLVATMDAVIEPVFGCDVQYDADRTKWVNEDFFGAQPFENFGLITDEKGCVSISGKVVPNLFAAGEILAGKVDIEESVSRVCRNIV